MKGPTSCPSTHTVLPTLEGRRGGSGPSRAQSRVPGVSGKNLRISLPLGKKSPAPAGTKNSLDRVCEPPHDQRQAIEIRHARIGRCQHKALRSNATGRPKPIPSPTTSAVGSPSKGNQISSALTPGHDSRIGQREIRCVRNLSRHDRKHRPPSTGKTLHSPHPVARNTPKPVKPEQTELMSPAEASPKTDVPESSPNRASGEHDAKTFATQRPIPNPPAHEKVPMASRLCHRSAGRQHRRPSRRIGQQITVRPAAEQLTNCNLAESPTAADAIR